MSVKCGHCKSRHVYVSDVKECADQEAEAKWEYEMELAAERYWEEGTPAQQAQYAWEAEQDERRFAF